MNSFRSNHNFLHGYKYNNDFGLLFSVNRESLPILKQYTVLLIQITRLQLRNVTFKNEDLFLGPQKSAKQSNSPYYWTQGIAFHQAFESRNLSIVGGS